MDRAAPLRVEVLLQRAGLIRHLKIPTYPTRFCLTMAPSSVNYRLFEERKCSLCSLGKEAGSAFSPREGVDGVLVGAPDHVIGVECHVGRVAVLALLLRRRQNENEADVFSDLAGGHRGHALDGLGGGLHRWQRGRR